MAGSPLQWFSGGVQRQRVRYSELNMVQRSKTCKDSKKGV